MKHAFYEWDSVFNETTPVTDWAPLARRMVVIVAADTTASILGIVKILRNNLVGLCYVELPAGGHMAPLSRPDLVNPAVIAALTGT